MPAGRCMVAGWRHGRRTNLDELPAVAVAVGELGGDVELPLLALLHQLHRLRPALDHLRSIVGAISDPQSSSTVATAMTHTRDSDRATVAVQLSIATTYVPAPAQPVARGGRSTLGPDVGFGTVRPASAQVGTAWNERWDASTSVVVDVLSGVREDVRQGRQPGVGQTNRGWDPSDCVLWGP